MSRSWLDLKLNNQTLLFYLRKRKLVALWINFFTPVEHHSIEKGSLYIGMKTGKKSPESSERTGEVTGPC